jgi:type IV fimbrial biogenesis protein FimT
MLMIQTKQLGFSIVELVVAVAILAILSAIAVPSYTEYIANSQIRATTESIRNGLQLARAEAVKRNATVRFTLNSDSSWNVGCPVATANCPILIQTKPAKEGASSTITLSATGSVDFTSLGVRSPAVGQLALVNVDNTAIPSANSRDLRVTVGAGGNMRVCDPNVSSSTDPRFC